MSEEGRVEESFVGFDGGRSEDGCSSEGDVFSCCGEQGGDLLSCCEGGVGVFRRGVGGEEGSFQEGWDVEVDEVGGRKLVGGR